MCEGDVMNRPINDGYFTVEVALIFPFVMGIILLVIYMYFYKYDRCLMEQDLGAALAEGMYVQNINMEERAKYVSEAIENTYRDEYWAWNRDAAKVSYDFRKITVVDEGSIRFPFKGFMFWDWGDIWSSEAGYEGKYVKKMFGIRTFRKMAGLFS